MPYQIGKLKLELSQLYELRQKAQKAETNPNDANDSDFTERDTSRAAQQLEEYLDFLGKQQHLSRQEILEPFDGAVPNQARDNKLQSNEIDWHLQKALELSEKDYKIIIEVGSRLSAEQFDEFIHWTKKEPNKAVLDLLLIGTPEQASEKLSVFLNLFRREKSHLLNFFKEFSPHPKIAAFIKNSDHFLTLLKTLKNLGSRTDSFFKKVLSSPTLQKIFMKSDRHFAIFLRAQSAPESNFNDFVERLDQFKEVQKILNLSSEHYQALLGLAAHTERTAFQILNLIEHSKHFRTALNTDDSAAFKNNIADLIQSTGNNYLWIRHFSGSEKMEKLFFSKKNYPYLLRVINLTEADRMLELIAKSEALKKILSEPYLFEVIMKKIKSDNSENYAITGMLELLAQSASFRNYLLTPPKIKDFETKLDFFLKSIAPLKDNITYLCYFLGNNSISKYIFREEDIPATLKKLEKLIRFFQKFELSYIKDIEKITANFELSYAKDIEKFTADMETPASNLFDFIFRDEFFEPVLDALLKEGGSQALDLLKWIRQSPELRQFLEQFKSDPKRLSEKIYLLIKNSTADKRNLWLSYEQIQLSDSLKKLCLNPKYFELIFSAAANMLSDIGLVLSTGADISNNAHSLFVLLRSPEIQKFIFESGSDDLLKTRFEFFVKTLSLPGSTQTAELLARVPEAAHFLLTPPEPEQIGQKLAVMHSGLMFANSNGLALHLVHLPGLSDFLFKDTSIDQFKARLKAFTKGIKNNTDALDYLNFLKKSKNLSSLLFESENSFFKIMTTFQALSGRDEQRLLELLEKSPLLIKITKQDPSYFDALFKIIEKSKGISFIELIEKSKSIREYLFPEKINPELFQERMTALLKACEHAEINYIYDAIKNSENLQNIFTLQEGKYFNFLIKKIPQTQTRALETLELIEKIDIKKISFKKLETVFSIQTLLGHYGVFEGLSRVRHFSSELIGMALNAMPENCGTFELHSPMDSEALKKNRAFVDEFGKALATQLNLQVEQWLKENKTNEIHNLLQKFSIMLNTFFEVSRANGTIGADGLDDPVRKAFIANLSPEICYLMLAQERGDLYLGTARELMNRWIELVPDDAAFSKTMEQIKKKGLALDLEADFFLTLVDKNQIDRFFEHYPQAFEKMLLRTLENKKEDEFLKSLASLSYGIKRALQEVEKRIQADPENKNPGTAALISRLEHMKQTLEKTLLPAYQNADGQRKAALAYLIKQLPEAFKIAGQMPIDEANQIPKTITDAKPFQGLLHFYQYEHFDLMLRSYVQGDEKPDLILKNGERIIKKNTQWILINAQGAEIKLNELSSLQSFELQDGSKVFFDPKQTKKGLYFSTPKGDRSLELTGYGHQIVSLTLSDGSKLLKEKNAAGQTEIYWVSKEGSKKELAGTAFQKKLKGVNQSSEEKLKFPEQYDEWGDIGIVDEKGNWKSLSQWTAAKNIKVETAELSRVFTNKETGESRELLTTLTSNTQHWPQKKYNYYAIRGHSGSNTSDWLKKLKEQKREQLEGIDPAVIHFGSCTSDRVAKEEALRQPQHAYIGDRDTGEGYVNNWLYHQMMKSILERGRTTWLEVYEDLDKAWPGGNFKSKGLLMPSDPETSLFRYAIKYKDKKDWPIEK